MNHNTDACKASLAYNAAGERIIKISFPYDLPMLENVRGLVGRKYHPENHVWSAPIYDNTLKKLISWGFILDESLQSFLQQAEEKRSVVIQKNIPGLKGTLFPFQSVGVQFIESRSGRALIGDEMGLGKTVQALAWLQMHPDFVPVVIVVPASLKLNWEKEARAWITNPRIEILNGTKPWTPTGDILIINYDVLANWVDRLRQLNPKVVITDECHYYKSTKTKRTKAVQKLTKGIPHVIALSGTPVINRPIEIFNAINIIDPSIFPGYWQYVQRYCNARHNRFGWDLSGCSNSEELHRILVDTIMIRRLKKDVLLDLPDKVYSFVPLELDNEKEYREANNNFIRFITTIKGQAAAEKAKKAEVLVQVETLKQLAVRGALRQSVEWIRNFLDVDGKLVVFASHKFVIDTLQKEFASIAVKLDGSTNNSERQKAVDSFQNDPNVRLFIGNIQAAGVGITLTASSNVVFLELPWTPGALRQAIDRVHRIGQKDCVNVYYLFATNTIMRHLVDIIDAKQRVLDAVLDGKESDENSLLGLLINSLLKQ